MAAFTQAPVEPAQLLVAPEPERTLETPPEPIDSPTLPAASAPVEFELLYAGKSLDELRQAQARVDSAIEQATKRTIDQLEAQGRFEVHRYNYNNDGTVEFRPPLTARNGEVVSVRTMPLDMHVYRYFPADFPELAALQAEAEWLKAKSGSK